MIKLAVNKTNPDIVFEIEEVARIPLMTGDVQAGIVEYYKGTYVDTSTVPDTRIENYMIQVDGIESDWLLTSPNVGGVSPVNNQNKEVTPDVAQQTITPDSGYTGLNKVIVDAVQLETVSVTPSTSSQTITPSEALGISQVNVAAVDASIDSNIQAENIAEGVTILGVEGTFQGGSAPTVENNTLVFESGASVSENTLVLGE